MMLRTVCSAAAAGTTGRLLILTYHRVVPAFDALRLDMDATTFAAQLAVLRQAFNPLPLAEGVMRLRNGDLPPRAVAVTFDDGYADNHDVAAPLLRTAGVPASFFVATGFLDGGRMWNDTFIETVRHLPSGVLDLDAWGLGSYRIDSIDSRRAVLDAVLPQLKKLPDVARVSTVNAIAESADAQLPAGLMMTAAQVAALADAGHEVGSHTVNHTMLAQLSAEQRSRELKDSRRRLAEITGVPPLGFAYPNGRPGIDYRHEDMLALQEAGYEYACSTAWGVASRDTDCWQLPRISPWHQVGARFALTLLKAFRRTGVALLTSADRVPGATAPASR